MILMRFFCGTNVCMKLFADDAKLYSSFDNFPCDLQSVCDKLKIWADKCHVRGDISKMSSQSFVTSQVDSSDDDDDDVIVISSDNDDDDDDDNDDMIIDKDDNKVDDEGNYSNSVCPSVSHRDFGELFISNYERMSNL